MNNFADRLNALVKKRGNPVCVGLDPRFDQLPAALRDKALADHGETPRAVAEAFLSFNRALLDAVADIAPVCKPQVAFYEEFGAEGMRAYAETVAYASQKGMLVISDAKRGDIGSTAVAYARAHLGKGSGSDDGLAGGFGADALTVNPYLGMDTLTPYMDVGAQNGKGIFVLVKTSNPGSGDLQDLKVEGGTVHEGLAQKLSAWGTQYLGESGYSSVGAVVAATYPEQARQLRALMPKTIFLIPGYGAQGATAKDAVAGFGADGLGGVINSSRGIIFAYKSEPYASKFGEDGFAEAAREATRKMAEELKAALQG